MVGKMFKISISLLSVLIILSAAYGCTHKAFPPEKFDSDTGKKALLVGTFHYHNPGRDATELQSFDILKKESQQELDKISHAIKHFKPTQIFVEWPHNEQEELDSLFHLYQTGEYFKRDSLSDFELKNEVVQLAFRVAELNNIDHLQAIDYKDTNLAYDSLMTTITENNQSQLKKKFNAITQKISTDFNTKIDQGASLIELTNYLNTPEFRELSNELHTEVPLLAGDRYNFIGAYSASEWFRRNLYMWSLIQKGVASNDDDRIMVLLGASHIATMETFIDEDNNWKTVELVDLMD